MAKRKLFKVEPQTVGKLLLVCVAFLLAIKLLEGFGGALLFFLLLFVVAVPAGFFLFVRYKKREKTSQEIAERFARLHTKYRDEAIVQRILSGQPWQGETAAQLFDSLGMPAAVDNNLLKTRKRDIWKYYPNGANRYRLRVTLDDDIVASWEQKN